jgi:hypothetical protein
MQVDLQLTPEEVSKRLGREVDDAIERLRRLGESLAEQLRDALSFKAADVVALTDAERAIVVDFENTRGTIRSIGLNFDGWGWSPTQLSQPLSEGTYRAVILISRRK